MPGIQCGGLDVWRHKSLEGVLSVWDETVVPHEAGDFVGQHGLKALQMGLINETLIDTRLKNLFKVRMRLQHFGE